MHIRKSPDTGTCNGTLCTKGAVLGEVVQASLRMANAIISNDCLTVLTLAYYDEHSSMTDLLDILSRTIYADRIDERAMASLTCRSTTLELLKSSSDIQDVAGLLSLIESASGIDVGEKLESESDKFVKKFLGVVQDIV
jgi:hypothetical protein